jgi:hypothetical protein
VLGLRGIDIASFYTCSIVFLNCSDIWYFLCFNFLFFCFNKEQLGKYQIVFVIAIK